jgi:glycerol-3-phosphate O-acyltransferase/dihydroxyacetone phosphate acyltransferase
MAENRDLKIKIVPVGLNYFHPHRFRSRAVVSYGVPITIEPELVEDYMKGGPAKHDAISKVLEAGYEGLKSVTINAPNYDTLMVSMCAVQRHAMALISCCCRLLLLHVVCTGLQQSTS